MARSGLNTSGNDVTADLPKPKVNKESLQRSLRIFRYVLPYRGKFIVGMVMLVLSSSTFMVFPWLAGKLIDAANHKPVVLPAARRWASTALPLLLFGVICCRDFSRLGASGFSRR